MLRLLNLHKQAAELARTSPQNLEHAEIAKSLEQELVHSMVRCLTDAMPNEIGYRGHQHLKIMRRLEEYLVAHSDRSMYLAEICAEVGVSERTLRICCEEQLGIGPIRFLWLRRMHLAHRALLQAEPKIATVTDIATKFGFWEFGRFSVEHRELFGELPSHSLRRPPADRRVSDGDPFALAAAEFA
jgi:transcriptional regulator GlxA family with amidase domain